MTAGLAGKRSIAIALIVVSLWSVPVWAQSWRDAYLKGLELMNAKRWGDAVQAFDRAIQENPREGKDVRLYGMRYGYFPHRDKGIALYELGRWDDAIAALQESLRQGPSDEAARFADLARRRQPTVDVGRVFQGTWWDHYDRGLVYAERGLWQPAIEDFRAALKERANEDRAARTYGVRFIEYFALRDLGVALYQTGQYQEAIQALERSVATLPSAKGAYYLNLARAAILRQSPADRNPPRIRIDEPAGGLVTNLTELAVRGAAESNNFVAEVAVQGDRVLVESAAVRTPFAKSVRLGTGQQDLVVTAKDLAGNQSRATVSVLVDREGPVVEIERFERTPANAIRVSGSVQDNVRLGTLVINAQPVALSGATQSRFSLDLAAQTAEVVVEATDAVGNMTRAHLPAPPRSNQSRLEDHADLIPVAWEWPWAGRSAPPVPPTLEVAELPSEVQEERIPVSWSVAPPDTLAEVRINNEGMTIKRTQGSKPLFLVFGHTVSLAPGENTVTIWVSDQSGQTASKTLKITRRVEEVKRIGSRLSVAVLAAEPREKSLFDGTYEVLVNALVNQGRFKIVERLELNRVLNELKLSRTELVDPSRAVRIGRIVAAEAVIVVSVKEVGSSAEVYARLINTETSTVMVMKDVFDPAPSPTTFRQMIKDLAAKILQGYPLIDGDVLEAKNGRLAARLSTAVGQPIEEMKMIVYQEGEPQVHEQSKVVLRRSETVIAEGSLVEVRPDRSYVGMKSKDVAVVERELAAGRKNVKVISK